MKKTVIPVVSFAITFLLFFQLAGTLVSSIYTLDLLHTSLDAKALGVLFFFAPVIYLVFRKNTPKWLPWVLFILIFFARGLTPTLNTSDRMLISGVGTAAIICLFPIMVQARVRGEATYRIGFLASVGLALSVVLSVMLRTANFGIDYSLTSAGSWLGWLLGALVGLTPFWMEFDSPVDSTRSEKRGVTSSLLGIFMVLTLIYFSFSAPAVFSRWTEGNYAVIVLCVSLLSLGWIVTLLIKPDLLSRLTPRVLIAWNLLFSLAVLGTILAHRVSFPMAVDSPAVIVSAPSLIQNLPLIVMLLLFPVLYLDVHIFWNRLQASKATPGQMAGGLLLGSFSLVLLVFMNIFTNVWGYVAPVSPFFRNKYWLPFLLICGLICLVVVLLRQDSSITEPKRGEPVLWVWGLLLVGILVVTTNGLFVKLVQPDPGARISSLTIMTYNIQQGNDSSGEQSYLRQLANIQNVAPDILAIQEGDSTRISLNNVDLIRFFADRLGYYSYYGPTTVTGSYGTAILSRFPLKNTLSVFTYSDQDENGTAEAQIEVEGRTFTIYNVHPDGTDDAKLALARAVLDRASTQSNVIILGDFNMRDYDAGYKLIDSVYTNSWMSVYPTGINIAGLDMTGKNRIDHIFVSKSLQVRDAAYLLPPASATDHPLHWAVIYWNK